MKHYDFEKVKQFIEKHSNVIQSASLGFNEDWFWTSEEIFNSETGFRVDLTDTNLKIDGINGSIWATPTLEVIYFDDMDERIEVSKGEFELEKTTQRLEREFMVTSGLGCLSKPCQDSRGEINRKI